MPFVAKCRLSFLRLNSAIIILLGKRFEPNLMRLVLSFRCSRVVGPGKDFVAILIPVGSE